MTVAGLLLAAGAGRRFGRPKALVEWDGEPLVSRGLRTLVTGGADPCLVVLGAAARQVREAAGLADGWIDDERLRDEGIDGRWIDGQRVGGGRVGYGQVVVAEDWANGIGASLCAGFAALAETSAVAAVVLLVDQPLVGPEAVRRLVELATATGGPTDPEAQVDALVATYGGRRGHPVVLHRRVWADVGTLAVGDVGARAWLSSRPGRVREVPCDGTGSPVDVDTPADLDRWRQHATD